MNEHNPGTRPRVAFGLILGGIFAVAAALFVVTGGELGGEKKSRATPIFRRSPRRRDSR